AIHRLLAVPWVIGSSGRRRNHLCTGQSLRSQGPWWGLFHFGRQRLSGHVSERYHERKICRACALDRPRRCHWHTVSSAPPTIFSWRHISTFVVKIGTPPGGEHHPGHPIMS